MSSRLKRMVKRMVERMVEVLVGVALAAAIVVVVPGVAEAQDVASTKDDPSALSTALSTAPKPTSMVVRPGDSLWSISRQWLGTNATPQQITEGVEQIYALNRNRIGADPDLIFAGQKLLVPPTMSERSTERSTGRSTGRSTRPTTARKITEAAEADPRGRAATSTTDKAPRTGVGGAAAKGGEAPEPVTEPVTLPDAAAPVPAVGSLASNDSPPSPVTSFFRAVRSAVASAVASVASVVAGYFAETFVETFAETRADERQLFGVGIIVLTLLVAAIMVWKLPMKRTTRWDAAVWATPTGYYGSAAAHRIAPFSYHPGSLGDSDTPAARGGRNAAATVGRIRTLRAKAGPRNGLALGAHNPEVRRASRRARGFMGARKSRFRRGASFGLGARS